MGVRLPAEYQEVEYLESTGTQYIDTGLVSNAPWKALFDISFAQVNTMQMYTGCYHNYDAYSDIRNYLRINTEGTLTIHNARGLASALDGLVATENTRYRIWAQLSFGTNMESLEINNDRYSKRSAFIAADLPIYLFAICRKTSSSQVAGNFMFGKVYKAKYYDLSNNKTADFVPCYRKFDSKPGMYDLITKQLFVNQGTGDDFLVGPDVIGDTSPWLMERRRLLMQDNPHMLYPIGTDVVTKYIRSVSGGFERGSINEDGEFVSGGGSYASQIYVPILPGYRFRKDGYRIVRMAWYDRNKEFISSFTRNNLSVQDLPAPPSNARFFRLGTYNDVNRKKITITRIS